MGTPNDNPDDLVSEVGAQGQKAAAPSVEPAPTGPGVAASARGALSALRRELADEELSSPGARKLLLELIDRSDAECQSLRIYQERYYVVNTRAEMLNEQVRSRDAFEVLYSVCLTIGGASIGLLEMAKGTPFQGWTIWIGGILIVGAIASKLTIRFGKGR